MFFFGYLFVIRVIKLLLSSINYFIFFILVIDGSWWRNYSYAPCILEALELVTHFRLFNCYNKAALVTSRKCIDSWSTSMVGCLWTFMLNLLTEHFKITFSLWSWNSSLSLDASGMLRVRTIQIICALVVMYLVWVRTRTCKIFLKKW